MSKLLLPLFQESRDIFGVLTFGLKYPKKYELIWADPLRFKSRIDHASTFKGWHPQGSGRNVICAGEWDQAVTPLTEAYLSESTPKYIGLQERIIDGKPWEGTKLYEAAVLRLERKGSVDGITTENGLKRRYENMDRLIEDVMKEGRLRTRQELDGSAFRERGGVPLLIGRKGKLILGRGGSHRFFISLILKVKLMPCALLAVHPESHKHFVSIRQESEELIQEHRKR